MVLANDCGWFFVFRFDWIRIISNFAGLGINPNGSSTFTNRPIHQSLLNFYNKPMQISSLSLSRSSMSQTDLTSLIWRNSFAGKAIAALAIGQRSSEDGIYSILVRTAKATGLVLHRSKASAAARVWSRGFVDDNPLVVAVVVVASRSVFSPSRLSDDCWL